jgi:hypothetical protein
MKIRRKLTDREKAGRPKQIWVYPDTIRELHPIPVKKGEHVKGAIPVKVIK